MTTASKSGENSVSTYKLILYTAPIMPGVPASYGSITSSEEGKTGSGSLCIRIKMSPREFDATRPEMKELMQEAKNNIDRFESGMLGSVKLRSEGQEKGRVEWNLRYDGKGYAELFINSWNPISRWIVDSSLVRIGGVIKGRVIMNPQP